MHKHKNHRQSLHNNAEFQDCLWGSIGADLHKYKIKNNPGLAIWVPNLRSINQVLENIGLLSHHSHMFSISEIKRKKLKSENHKKHTHQFQSSKHKKWAFLLKMSLTKKSLKFGLVMLLGLGHSHGPWAWPFIVYTHFYSNNKLMYF